MYETIQQVIQGGDFSVMESFVIPGRPARYDEVPQVLAGSLVGDYLNQQYPAGLWTHQSKALESLGDGDNIVISTGTASGKSLVFQALALHKVVNDPSSRVVVLPAYCLGSRPTPGLAENGPPAEP